MRCSRYASSSVALGLTSVPSPLAPPPSVAFRSAPTAADQRVLPRDLDPIAAVLHARPQQPVARCRSPWQLKRSRSEIQLSLMASFSRGTTRRSLPRSTCA